MGISKRLYEMRNTPRHRGKPKFSFVNKKSFFDSKEVIAAVSEAERKVLSKFGAHTRQTAKQSLRKKEGASNPGQPPHSHLGYLKRGILFAYDRGRKSVVIGPNRLSKKGNAPEVLEKGCNSVKRKNPRRKDRKIGDSGIVLLRKTNSKSSKQVKDWQHKPRWVTFGTLKTAKQVACAERNETDIWGPKIISGSIEARPHMAPAFERELAKMPPNWRDSIK